MKKIIKIRWTYQLVKEFIEKKGYILVSQIFKNIYTKLIICDSYGYYYFLSLQELQHNHIPCKFHINNPYTIQNIKLWCNINQKLFKLVSEIYKGSTKNMEWKCLKDSCGDYFKSNWSAIQNGNGCGVCHGKQIGNSNCLANKRPDLASEWHPTKNGDLTPYDVTCGSRKEIWWQCNKNPKHEWKIRMADRNKGSGCPYCSGRYPSDENNLLIANPKLCEEWNYEKNDKKPEEYLPNSMQVVWWICKDCGDIWKSNINNRHYGTGCPKCSESKGEKRIKEICKLYNIPFDKQYTFDNLIGVGGGLLKFDVPIFWDEEKTKLRILIEFDGEQHFKWIKGWLSKKDFKETQHHDRLKNEYCKKNNIPLLRIKYDQFDNIEQILQKELHIR